MKKLVAIILCMVMLLTIIPVLADETVETEKAQYTITFRKSRPEIIYPTYETKGDRKETSQFIDYNGKTRTSLRLYDRYENECSMKFTFLSGDLHYSNTESNQEWVKPAYYDIYFYQPNFWAGDDTKATVTVYHNGETTTLTMNQVTNQEQAWNKVSIDPLYFSGSGDEYIKITKSRTASQLAVGDIRIIENTDVVNDVTEPPVDDAQQEAETKPLISDVTCQNDTITLTTNGSTLNNNKTVYAIVAAYTEGTLTAVKQTTITITPKSSDATITLNTPTTESDEYKVFISNNNLIETYSF